MARGKKQEVNIDEEIITPEIERQAEMEMQREKQEEDLNEDVKKLMEKAKQEGGSVIVKLKKKNEVKAVNIGKYKANEFDEDLIARQFGGGTYYYTLRDEHGRIRGKWEEEYAEPINKNVQQNPQADMFVQMSTIIKDLTKEIADIKTEVSKPKVENTDDKNMVLELIKQNQIQQVEIFKALTSLNKPQQSSSITEVLTAITTIMPFINKQPQQQPQEQKSNIGDLVELAGLFADLKANGDVPKQETIIDVIKSFLTDGSLANVIAILKQPKQPLIPNPNDNKQLSQGQQVQQVQQVQQGQQPQQQTEKDVMQTIFKQYEQQLFQMKVNGNNAEYIANTILSAFDFSEDLKKIGYTYFKDKEFAYNGLMEVATVFKNEQELLKKIVEIIHDYFDYDGKSETEGEIENEQQGQ